MWYRQSRRVTNRHDAAKNAAKSCAAMVLSAALMVAAIPASAALLYVEETFDYPSGGLNGLNGGIGWTSAWSAQSNVSVEEGAGLFFGALGNSLASRNFTSLPDDGTTYWINWETQTAWTKEPTISFQAPNGTSVLTFSSPNNSAAWQIFGTQIIPDTRDIWYQVLTRIVTTGDSDLEAVTVYVNPDLDLDPTQWTAAATGTVNANDGLGRWSWSGGGQSTGGTAIQRITSIRIADNWQQAAIPVPEPAGLLAAAAGLGLAAAFLRRASAGRPRSLGR